MTEKEFRNKERNDGRKKSAKMTKRKRRRKLAAAALTLLIVVISVIAVLAACFVFKAENIRITGNTIYSNDEILAVADINVGDSLLLLPTKKISRNLQTSLPFINTARIKRQFPDSIIIEIEETSEQVMFVGADKFYSSNFDGKILKEESWINESLVKVTLNSEFNATVGQNIVFSNEIEEKVYNEIIGLINEGCDITAVNISNQFDIYLIVENRLVFRFGSSSDFDGKKAHMLAMLKKMTVDEEGIADLSGWSKEKPEAFFTQKNITSYK